MAGLEPTLAAIEGGKKKIAIANKETLVCAGDIVMQKAKEKGVCMFPVDSEHSAIFQCLAGGNKIKRILLTASGGPFFGKSYDELKEVDAKKALAHPTWNMGAKITVDSATLANKGFEIIEACHLFGVSPDDIQVVVHRESIIHSMVEFEDNCVIAQMSLPDMRECIQYALTYPLRAPSKTEPIDFYTLGKLTFAKPDTTAFPLLDFACKAYKMGGIIPSCLNGANEEAVKLFLEDRIKFTDVTELVIKVTESFENIKDPDIETIIESGYIARRKVAELVK
jgi:1-deoxy-D-xylulose-5-phosphate reductoisomerase